MLKRRGHGRIDGRNFGRLMRNLSSAKERGGEFGEVEYSGDRY